MKRYNSLIFCALALGVAVPAAAQVASKTCSASESVGYIGISGIDCDCTISAPGSGHDWVFRTEPKITSLEMDTRAGTLLRIGDVITAVNGKLITTRDGARALETLKPGESVVLTIRRNGETRQIALSAGSVCPDDSRLFSIYAPGRAYAAVAPGVTPPPSIAGVSPDLAPVAGAVPRGAAPKAIPTPGAAYAVVAPRAGAAWYAPRASYGMGLTCSNCVMSYSEKDKVGYMSFSRPPEVYSIERGGPADKAGIRRGDVITHVNDKPIDSAEGGKIFGGAKAGQIVRFTIVRNNERKTYSVRAVQATVPPPALAQSSKSLEAARASLSRLQRSQEEQLRRLEEAQRNRAEKDLSNETKRMLEQQHRQMLREEQEHSRQIARLADEMARASRSMNAASCAVPAPSPSAVTTPLRTLRYTGSLGTTDIEVRGAPASVTETADEIVITTGSSVVRISKKK